MIVMVIFARYYRKMKQRSTPPNDRTPLVELQAMPNGGGSDITLKKDVHGIQAGLALILALRPVRWRWKASRPTDRQEYGFVAQEVEDVLPDLVSINTWDDGTERKFLSTKELIPYLVAAVQEQNKQIETLTAQLEKSRKS